MLSGNGLKTERWSCDELHEHRRLTMLSGNGAQNSLFPDGMPLSLWVPCSCLSNRRGRGGEILTNVLNCENISFDLALHHHTSSPSLRPTNPSATCGPHFYKSGPADLVLLLLLHNIAETFTRRHGSGFEQTFFCVSVRHTDNSTWG